MMRTLPCEGTEYKTHGITCLSHAVTNQIAFDKRDLHSTLEFESVMDRCCQALEVGL